MKVRPRLADHALARRHLRDGDEIVVIHDARDGSLCSLSPETYAVVACADGTRDIEGIALAASRAGIYTRLSEIQSTLAELEALGLLDEGVEPGPLPPVTAERWEAPAPADRASAMLEHLPGYGFCCTGSGSCCRQYGSVALSEADVARARRAGLTEVPGAARGERVFLPLYGAVRTERVVMTMVNGACLELTSGGRCGLELRGGALAKPVGCRSYPATLVDDGESVRVSVAPECDCVFESRANGATGRLVSGATAADLPAGLGVRRLGATVALGGAMGSGRSAYAAWSREVSATIEPGDVPGRAAALAAALAQRGLSPWPSSATSPAELSAALRAFAASMERAAASAESWRSPSDRTRILRRAVASAAAQAGDAVAAVPSARHAEDEAFTARAALFGHQLATGSDLASGLLGLAARLVVARVIASRAPELGHPIAAVMAASRGASG